MICIPCCAGGDISEKIRLRQIAAVLGRAAAIAQHQRCKRGTWCDCQCLVSPPDPRIPETRGLTFPAGWCGPADAVPEAVTVPEV